MAVSRVSVTAESPPTNAHFRKTTRSPVPAARKIAPGETTSDLSFAAIDFETANRSPTSACAVGVVVVSHGEVTRRAHRLIKPPKGTWNFTAVHGIRESDVQSEAPFRQVWSDLAPLLTSAPFLAAHNAAFDSTVLYACCREAELASPRTPFVCTLALSRDQLHIQPLGLATVCRTLGIPLQHHNPLSDAEAAAKVIMEAARRGWRWKP